MDKPEEQTRDRYFAADSVEDFLFAEFENFFGEGLDTDGRTEASATALERAVEGSDQLVASEVPSDKLATIAIAILDKGQDIRCQHTFLHTPSPETLLLYAAHNCEPDEEVFTITTFNNGDQNARHATWPFGMETAVELTAVTNLSSPDFESITTPPIPARLRHYADHALSFLHVDQDPFKATLLGAAAATVLALAFRRRR
jgi:hypothetical protein